MNRYFEKFLPCSRYSRTHTHAHIHTHTYTYTHMHTCTAKTNLVQFSSFWFDNPGNTASPIDMRFSCMSWAPLVGDGDDIFAELAWVTINGIAQTCFSGRANSFFARCTTLQRKNQRLFSGIRTQDRAWARHWRLSLYQSYTYAYVPKLTLVATLWVL